MLGLLRLWRERWVDPETPPSPPLLILARQLLAVSNPSPEPDRLVAEALDGLRLSACVPRDLALEMFRRRLSDPAGFEQALPGARAGASQAGEQPRGGMSRRSGS